MKLVENTGKKKKEKDCMYYDYGLFLCPICGSIVERKISNGTKSQSCNCFTKEIQKKKKIIHGDALSIGEYHKLYGVWSIIKDRCLNPKYKQYAYYGGRGIIICEEWKNSFIIFKNWSLNNGYRPNLCIDRIDFNGNYTPSNCRFVTHYESDINRRSTKLNWDKVFAIRNMYLSEHYKMVDLANKYDISISTINMIINNIIWKKENYFCSSQL